MFKAIVCILIIFSAGGLGWAKAYTYEQRVQLLKNIIDTIESLESEMKYRIDPLPQALKRICVYKKGVASDFFKAVAQSLEDSSNIPFSTIWDEKVESFYSGSVLNAADLVILKEIGPELGKTGLQGQSSLFSRVHAYLDNQLAEAEEEKKTKGKMYKSLGFAIGIAIVIIFI